MSLAIPESLALQNIVTFGGVLARSNNYISARPESGYQPNQLCSIEWPLECVDNRSGTLQFTMQGVPAVASTYNRFPIDIRSIFTRLVIRFGSKPIYDVSNNDLLINILNQTKDTLWASTVGKVMNGTGDTTSRNADFNDPTRVYSVQLYDLVPQFFNRVLPLHKLGVQMYFDFYLNSANVIETDGTANTASFSLNNVQFHYASIVPSDNWNNLYNTRVIGGIPYNYLAFENMYDTAILPAGVRNASKVLTFRKSSLLGIIAVMRTESSLNTQSTSNRLSTFNFNALSSAQLRVGSANYPIDTKRSYSDLLSMFLETFNISSRLPTAIANDYNTTNFILAIPLSRHPKEWTTAYESISGVNTSISSSMVLDLGFNVPIPSNQRIDFFAMSEESVIFNANGSITWQN